MCVYVCFSKKTGKTKLSLIIIIFCLYKRNTLTMYYRNVPSLLFCFVPAENSKTPSAFYPQRSLRQNPSPRASVAIAHKPDPVQIQSHGC